MHPILEQDVKSVLPDSTNILVGVRYISTHAGPCGSIEHWQGA